MMETKRCNGCKDFLCESEDGVGICAKTNEERSVFNKCNAEKRCGMCAHLYSSAVGKSFYCMGWGRMEMRNANSKVCGRFKEREN